MKFELTAAQAKTLGAALKPAISTDKTRPHLHTVEIVTYENSVQFTATDGYRCHRVTIETPVTEWLQGSTVLSGAEFIKALTSAAKVAKYREIVVSYDYGQTVELAIGEEMYALIDVCNSEFPPCNTFLEATSPLEGNALFNGDYFAETMTAAAAVANIGCKPSDPRGVEIVTINPRKCGKVVAASNDGKVTFTGVIMPQRG